MTCSLASTLSTTATIPLLPVSVPTTNGAWQRVRITLQQSLQQLQGAAGATGVNVIPQQYALLGGTTLPPIVSTSNCTLALDDTDVLFGNGSYRLSITGSPATLTLSADTAWLIQAGWQWIVSFFQQASAAIAGVLTITTPVTTYATDFTTTLSSAGFQRLFDTVNLGADASTSFGLSFTFTGGTGQTVWLDGLMMEPYANVAMGASPFISTSAALNADNLPDGATYVRLLAANSATNAAYNYKGAWNSATAYSTADEVVYSDSYWLAIANSTNSAPATGNANWQLVGTYSGFEGAWSAATDYTPGAEVTYAGNFWICLVANINSAPTTTNTNWQIAGPASLDDIADGITYVKLLASNAAGNVAYNYKGLWVSTTAYVKGDEVFYGASYWVCLTANTNSAPSTSNANWQVVGTYSAFLGAWSSATAYDQGAEVTYGGNYWVCVSANTNSAPTTSNANWQIAGPATLDDVADGTNYVRILATNAVNNIAYNYQGIWSSATAYKKGDEVFYEASYWLCVIANTSSAPGTSNANWQVVGTYSAFLGAWSSATAYAVGAEVTYSGNYWVCVTANTNSAPTTSNSNWQIAGPTNLDDIADGATYGRIRLSALNSGLVNVLGVTDQQSGSVAVGATPTVIVSASPLSAAVNGVLYGRVNLSVASNNGVNATVQLTYNGSVVDSVTVSVETTETSSGSIPVTLMRTGSFAAVSVNLTIVVTATGGTPNVTVSGGFIGLLGILN